VVLVVLAIVAADARLARFASLAAGGRRLGLPSGDRVLT
jgi:hypothetical protein